MDSDVEISSRFIGQGAHHGHHRVRPYWQDLIRTLPDTKVQFQEARELGGLVPIAVRVRRDGTGSDAPFDEAAWVTARVQDGTCVWWRAYSSEVEALEVAGLRE